MAGNSMKVFYIIVLILTIIFAIVELGLAGELVWQINRGFIGFRTLLRPRTRYLVFCSGWSILAGILLLMFMTMADSVGAIVAQVIVMFITMVFWLIGAALFTSAVGGGINCGPGFPSCFIVNIVNTTLAFAWINWSFVLIAFFLALCLAFFGQSQEKTPNPQNTMRGTGAAPASNPDAPTSTQSSV